MQPLHLIDNLEEIGERIIQLATCAPGLAALLRHAQQGTISVLQIARAASVPMRVLRTAAEHRIICVVGEDDYCSTGPSGWRAMPRLLGWAKSALIHAARSDAASYQLAVDMALRCRRSLLIETDTPHLQEWIATVSARGIEYGVVVPTDGPHPIPLRPEDLQ
jgi:hypothetical protein